MDAASPLKRAFDIDEILLTIYGFLVGNDMNSNVKMMKVRLVSSRFNKLFISCMRSIPLQFKYMACDGIPARECPIVRWLKSYNIETLSKLVVDVEERDKGTFCEDFDGLDLSNLKALELSIYGRNPVRDASYVQAIFPTFAQSTSLTSLKLFHNNEIASAKTVYDNFLSYFPVLDSLEVTLINTDNADGNISTTLEYPKKLEHLVIHQLDNSLEFRSESVKTWDVSSCQYLDSIISIDCPSLEKIICRTTKDDHYPSMMIVGIGTDTLAEQFGNTDKDYIFDYLRSNNHHINSSDIESIVSISVVPMDYITGRNIPIKVRSDCVIVLFDLLFS
mmetsp:Transcript_21935/g.24393  ORF Transcript_21935/g.24393 Transcript_21935/m.24393 type:complete len:334 (-) Transcript_21935:216-1217(-)